MTEVRLLPRDDERDDFEYEDEHVELESELGEYGEDDGSEDNERPTRKSSAIADDDEDDLNDEEDEEEEEEEEDDDTGVSSAPGSDSGVRKLPKAARAKRKRKTSTSRIRVEKRTRRPCSVQRARPACRHVSRPKRLPAVAEAESQPGVARRKQLQRKLRRNKVLLRKLPGRR